MMRILIQLKHYKFGHLTCGVLSHTSGCAKKSHFHHCPMFKR